MDWRWQTLESIKTELAAHPERFTPWFPLALPHALELATATKNLVHTSNLL
jgi:isopentenyldiphosphate isomerase